MVFSILTFAGYREAVVPVRIRLPSPCVATLVVAFVLPIMTMTAIVGRSEPGRATAVDPQSALVDTPVFPPLAARVRKLALQTRVAPRHATAEAASAAAAKTSPIPNPDSVMRMRFSVFVRTTHTPVLRRLPYVSAHSAVCGGDQSQRLHLQLRDATRRAGPSAYGQIKSCGNAPALLDPRDQGSCDCERFRARPPGVVRWHARCCHTPWMRGRRSVRS